MTQTGSSRTRETSQCKSSRSTRNNSSRRWWSLWIDLIKIRSRPWSSKCLRPSIGGTLRISELIWIGLTLNIMCSEIKSSLSKITQESWSSKTQELYLSRSRASGSMKPKILIVLILGASCTWPTARSTLDSHSRQSRRYHCSSSIMRPSNL